MKKEIFKVGDKVFVVYYGWGVIRKFERLGVVVDFENNSDVTCDIRLLSFTEYTLQGFTQDRPIELPEVGELCLVRDGDDERWVIGEFKEFKAQNEYKYVLQNSMVYKQLKRIKILD